MHYVYNDVIRLFAGVPVLRLAKPDNARSFLSVAVRDGSELCHVLRAYPQVRYQPLEFFYACLQSLGAQNEKLIEDLTSHYTWRGVVWAAWLVALAPEARFAPYLKRVREGMPHNQWIVELALCEVEGSLCEKYSNHQGLVRTMRSLLHEIPRPTIELRKAPNEAELQELEVASRAVLVAYRSRGVDAALRTIRESKWPMFL